MFRNVYQIHRVVSSVCGVCGDVWWRTPVIAQGARSLTLSWAHYKKRKTPEERQAEREGRKVIRYSPKVSPDKVVGIWRNMSVQEVADVLKKDIDHVLESLNFADKDPNARYNERSIIHNQEVLRKVIKLSGFRFKIVSNPGEELEEEKNRDAVPAPPAPPENLRPRPPVVCVMGHVDHGKTTLLDALRDTSVVDTEFGGITQHIGAFSVQLPSGEKVTFLDTPGHAAFSAMRSRGAHATDIVLLVVAADDGVMEQTIQSIRMARDADVPILVAINKMDKPSANPKRALEALATHGVVAESLGGDVQAIPVSAKAKTNLNTLVEALSLQAQLMDIKADPTGYVEGVVVEAQLNPAMGKQATVLVRRGTLRRGCVLVAGSGWAKTRVMLGSDGNTMTEAPPATPVRVLGWKDLPAAGDVLLEVESEKRANEVMRWRAKKKMEEKQSIDEKAIQVKEAEHQVQYRAYLERKRALGRFKLRREGPKEKEIKEDTHPTLRVIFKGDVDGSVEAILDVMDTYDEHEVVRLDIVHFGVGHVTPSDLDIAEAFKAIIYTFNVELPSQLQDEVENRNITVKRHNVIYKMIDDIKEEINVRIPMRQAEEVLGEANVLQPFMISEKRKKLCVAGSRCVKGSLSRHALYRIIRGQSIIFEGQLASMKHLKNEVDTIKKDMECGLRFASDDLEVKAGDTIICYHMVDAPTTTQWDPGF